MEARGTVANAALGGLYSLSVMESYISGLGDNSSQLTLLSLIMRQVVSDTCLWLVADYNSTLDCSDPSELSFTALALGLNSTIKHMESVVPSGDKLYSPESWIAVTITDPKQRCELCDFADGIKCVDDFQCKQSNLSSIPVMQDI